MRQIHYQADNGKFCVIGQMLIMKYQPIHSIIMLMLMLSLTSQAQHWHTLIQSCVEPHVLDQKAKCHQFGGFFAVPEENNNIITYRTCSTMVQREGGKVYRLKHKKSDLCHGISNHPSLHPRFQLFLISAGDKLQVMKETIKRECMDTFPTQQRARGKKKNKQK